MKKKSERISAVVLSFFAACIAVSVVVLYRCNANSVEGKTDSEGTVKTPMIIWFQDIETGPEALELAISGGIFSHVLLEGVNQLDKPDYFVKPKFRKALKVLRKYKNVKFIWCRWLYPGHKLDNFKIDDAFDAEYYARQIRQIREEAKLLGADFVAFDAEPYVKCPLKVIKNRKLSEKEFQELNSAIKIATKVSGQVDFVLPAAMHRPNRLYNATQHLGKLIINEHTYFDVPESLNHTRLNEDKVPYDIFGAYVSINKKNPKNPKAPYFTPREILERQELWSGKKGLFIFPGYPKNAATVALEFSKIRTAKPVPESNAVR